MTERGNDNLRRVPKIRISPVAALMALGLAVSIAWGGEALAPWFAVLAAATVHELGHLLVACLCHVQVSELRLDIMGARIHMDGLMSYPAEWLVAFGGPAVNLASALAVYPFLARGECAIDGVAYWFLMASLGLGLLNLLPVGTMDGGRMLHCFVAWLFGERAAVACLRLTTCTCLMILWLTSVYVLLRAGQMLSLFTFSMCLLFRFAVPDGCGTL